MIRVNDLSHTYADSGINALKKISFSIEGGEIYGFLGPSGAGKSTAQKIMMGLLPVQSGQVQIDGRPLNDLGPAYKERIGVAFEFPHFYPRFTARENIRFYAGLYERPVSNTEIDDWFVRLGLEEYRDKRVDQFSKGMKMRLNLIRALAHDPDILYLDEPTSGLDPLNSRNVRQIIRELKARGKTIFLTTHNMEVAAELCDKVAFITDGALADTDSPASFMLRYGNKRITVEDSEDVRAEFDLAGLGSNDGFIEWLKTHDIKSIHSQEASLEDVFIAITGRSLR